MENRLTTGLAVGLVLGAAIGVTIGLLYAPRPGAETRTMLREKAGELKEKAAELANRIRHREEAETPV